MMRRDLNKFKTESQQKINQYSLTGLSNRHSVMERLEIEIEQCQRNLDRKFALMFVDLEISKA